jgi:hypothetical protein
MTAAFARRTALTVTLAALAVSSGEAHKPITSKYTFNEHVLPIVRDRCAACHVDGGPAPMSLLTYADARPWAESIRAELVAAHMPPSQADSGVARIQNARLLSARELDTILTWATGGTPEGLPLANPRVTLVRQPIAAEPDVTIPLPSDVVLAPGAMETTREFELASDALEGRAIRAVDLLPGTPAMVRRAVIYIQPPASEPAGGLQPDRIVAVWSPGNDSVSPPDGVAFVFPRSATLVARITYRKTWKYENTSMSDRSRVGVYFASQLRPREILAMPVSTGTVVADDVEAIAVRAEASAADTDVRVTAALPGGSHASMIRFTGQPEWPMRFWYAQPVALPRGTRLESTAAVVLDVVRRAR